MSFSSYIRTVAAGTSEYVGIPAFVSRLFRHSGIYVRADAGISKPEDLRGKRDRPARIPDHRGGLDARHAAARIRREADRDPLAQRRPGGGRAATSARRSSRSRASTSSRSARTRRWSACCATASSTRCSRRAAPSSFLARRAAHQAAVPRHARGRAWPTTRRPGCSRSCTWSASASRWSRSIRGCRPASTRRSCEAKALAMIDLLDVNALMVTLPWLDRRDQGDAGAHGQGLLALRRRTRAGARSRR